MLNCVKIGKLRQTKTIKISRRVVIEKKKKGGEEEEAKWPRSLAYLFIDPESVSGNLVCMAILWNCGNPYKNLFFC